MKKLFILFATILMTSCATTRLYKDGKKIADFQGDMTGVEYMMTSDGDVYWKTTTTNHSTATLAQGEAAKSKIQAGGAALAASGLTLLLK